MQKYLTPILVIFGVMQTFARPVESTFHHLVCNQCNSWCSAEQYISEGPPRAGKAGPRGDVGPPGAVGMPGVVGPRGLPGGTGPVGPSGIVNMTAIEDIIDRKIREALLRNEDRDTTGNQNEPVTARSCQGISLESAKSRNETGGVFDINVSEIGLKEVYCDVRTDGGNWIVFQRRMDGSVDFNRLWNDYVNGFGNLIGEFWLGLEAIHQLTKTGRHELRFDMIERDGTHHYAKYSSFKVGPASDNYRLSVSGYSGNATDAFANPTSHPGAVLNGMRFTTRDKYNDRGSRNCAKEYEGGWWFNNCEYSLLNGRYNIYIRWVHQTRYRSMNMRFTEMKFRQRQ